MKFGLEEKIYKDIKEVLLQFPYTFYIFGSRAKGNYKKTSDIDLAILEKIDNEEQSNSYEPAKPNKYFAFVIVCTVVLCCFAFRYRGHC